MVSAPALWDAGGGGGGRRAAARGKATGAGGDAAWGNAVVSNPLNSLTRAMGAPAQRSRQSMSPVKARPRRYNTGSPAHTASSGKRDASVLSRSPTLRGRLTSGWGSPGRSSRRNHSPVARSLTYAATTPTRFESSRGRGSPRGSRGTPTRRRPGGSPKAHSRSGSAQSRSGSHSYTLNSQDRTHVRDVEHEDPAVEHLYLRENNFKDFDPYLPLTNLKTLDLALNMLPNLQFLWEAQPDKQTASGPVPIGPPILRLPNLRHLYLTGNEIRNLSGLGVIPHLETLTLSNNLVGTLRGFCPQQHLHVLSCHHNLLKDFDGFPALPELRSVHFVGNPVASHPFYRIILLMLAGTLERIDNEPVRHFERVEAGRGDAKLRLALMEGWLPTQQQPPAYKRQEAPAAVDIAMWHAEADAFLFNRQTVRDGEYTDKTLRVVRMELVPSGNPTYSEDAAGLYGGSENVPLDLHVCLVDTRARSVARAGVYHSHSLVPVEFRVQTGAKKRAHSAHLITNLNNYEPIAMKPDDTEFGSFFVTLYTSPGTCLYKYVVDDREVVDEPVAITEDGYEFTKLLIAAPAMRSDVDDEECRTSVLHVRWLHSNEAITPPLQLFAPVEAGEEGNCCRYTPTDQTVGRCVRAEVLCYDAGRLESCFYCLSNPIAPSPPELTHLDIDGDAVEGEMLMLRRVYKGGAEGPSVIRWARQHPDGLIEDLHLPEEMHDVYLLKEGDVGCEIYVTCTPVRSDGEVGAMREAHTAKVAALAPTIEKLRFTGAAVEGLPLTVKFMYSGGRPGEHRYEWFNATHKTDLPSATGPQYTPIAGDLNCAIECRVTPVSAAGVEGAPVTVASAPVGAGEPQLSRLRLEGVADETGTLTLVYEYSGGGEGATNVEWAPAKVKRRDGSSRKHRVPGVGDSVASDALEERRVVLCTYPLSVQHIGKIVTAKVTPVRGDGKEGRDYFVSSDRIRPAEPKGTIAVAGQAVTGQQLTVTTTYRGGVEGASSVVWGKVSAKTGTYVWGATPTQLLDHRRIRVVQEEDVGVVLAVKYTPVRSDGRQGLPVIAVLDKPVQMPGPTPLHLRSAQEIAALRDVLVTFPEVVREFDTLRAPELLNLSQEIADLPAVYQWSRVRDPPANPVNLPVSTAPVYTVAREDVGCRISCSVRIPDLAVFGQAVSGVVVPALQDVAIDVSGAQATTIRCDGLGSSDVLVGARLEAGFSVSDTLVSKQALDVAYQWEVYRDGNWQTVARTKVYHPSEADVGCRIRLGMMAYLHRAGSTLPDKGTKVYHEFGVVKGAVAAGSGIDALSHPRWGTSSAAPSRGTPHSGSKKAKAKGKKPAAVVEGSSAHERQGEKKKVYTDYLKDNFRAAKKRRSKSVPLDEGMDRADPSDWDRPWRDKALLKRRGRGDRSGSVGGREKRGDDEVVKLTLPKASFVSPARLMRFDSSVARRAPSRPASPGSPFTPTSRSRFDSKVSARGRSLSAKSEVTTPKGRSRGSLSFKLPDALKPKVHLPSSTPPEPERGAIADGAAPDGFVPPEPQWVQDKVAPPLPQRITLAAPPTDGIAKMVKAESVDATEANKTIDRQPTLPWAKMRSTLLTYVREKAEVRGLKTKKKKDRGLWAKLAPVSEAEKAGVDISIPDKPGTMNDFGSVVAELIRKKRAEAAAAKGGEAASPATSLPIERTIVLNDTPITDVESHGSPSTSPAEKKPRSPRFLIPAQGSPRSPRNTQNTPPPQGAGGSPSPSFMLSSSVAPMAESVVVETPVGQLPAGERSTVGEAKAAGAGGATLRFHDPTCERTPEAAPAADPEKDEGRAAPAQKRPGSPVKAAKPKGAPAETSKAPSSDSHEPPGAKASPAKPKASPRCGFLAPTKASAARSSDSLPEPADPKIKSSPGRGFLAPTKASAARSSDSLPEPADPKIKSSPGRGFLAPTKAFAARRSDERHDVPRSRHGRSASVDAGDRTGPGSSQKKDLPVKPPVDYTPAEGKNVPRFTKLAFASGAVTGVGLPTALIAHYKGGGVEGKSELFWQRRYEGDEEWADYYNKTSHAVTPTADDVHCQFRACGIPRNSLGVRGPYLYSDVLGVAWGKNLAEDILQALIRGPSFVASVSLGVGGIGKTYPECVVSLSEKKLKLRPDIGTPRPFAEAAMDGDHRVGVVLPRTKKAAQANTSFTLTMTEQGVCNSYQVTLPEPSTPLERDFSVLLIRVWAALSDHATCEAYLGAPFADQWRDGILDIPDRAKRDDLCRKAFEQRAPPVLPGKPSTTKEENVRALACLCFDKATLPAAGAADAAVVP